MNWAPVAILLHASFADHVRTMVPVPLQDVSPRTLSEKVTVTELEQLSMAVACPVVAVLVFCSHEIVIAGGMVSTGAWKSMMTMVWIQAATFPHISVACQCLVNVPVPLHPV